MSDESTPAGAIAKVATAGAGAIALILAALFVNEGGYVNDPRDPGGETNHGVTKRVAVANGYDGPMKALPKGMAAEIYVREYMDKPGFRPFIERDIRLGEELVDTGVNVGPAREGRWLQESLNHFNNRGADYPDIKEDGRVGPATVAAYDALRRRRGGALACQLLVKALDAKQAAHYMQLGGTNGTMEAFMVGWFRTRIGNVDLSQCGKAPA